MAGEVGSLVFCCWPVSPVGNALPSSFLDKKVEILLFIQIVTAVQPLLKIQHMLRCFCWERTARWSRRNQALSCLTASLLTYGVWDAKGFHPEQSGWVVFHAVMNMLSFNNNYSTYGLICYINIALTAITKTCNSNKLRERDTQVCIAWLYNSFFYFVMLLLQESLEKRYKFYFFYLLNMCLVYIIFHFSLAVVFAIG